MQINEFLYLLKIMLSIELKEKLLLKKNQIVLASSGLIIKIQRRRLVCKQRKNWTSF